MPTRERSGCFATLLHETTRRQLLQNTTANDYRNCCAAPAKQLPSFGDKVGRVTIGRDGGSTCSTVIGAIS